MEIRSIVKEVTSLIYEWEEEEVKNDCNNINDIHANQNVPQTLKSQRNIDNKLSVQKQCDEISSSNCISDQNYISQGSELHSDKCCDKLILESTSDDIVEDYNKAIRLTTRRLDLMEQLGFKVITRLDTCSNIVEYANEIGDLETSLTYLQKGCELAKILYGICSLEASKWKLEIEKVNKTIIHN